jgi:hypothetical protein
LKVLPLIVLFLGLLLPSQAVEFRIDVMAVLSKAGCNLGSCHGNASGKGGLKLSLRGQDPDLDWLALVREQGGRRVNLLEPEQSLILLKARGVLAHEGGKRFSPGDPEHEILLQWLRDGAQDSGAEKRVAGLEVTPPGLTMAEAGRSVQIQVKARFTDGSERDVTRLAFYEPNNQLAKITPEGAVSSDLPGETTVLARYLDQQVPVRIAFVPSRPNFAWDGPTEANFIDTHVFRKLKLLRVNPSAVCDDTTFLRRAYLDLLGVLPTAETARAFLVDSRPEKRSLLVERLLQRSEFADFWALKWADLLKIEERQLDKNGMAVFHAWIRDSIAADKPLDQFARELIAARGSTYKNPAANWWRANRDPITRAENTSRVFLGVQLNCAQCHNHPFDRWTQDDYYNWASLFARVDYKILENKRRDKSDTREFKGDQEVLLKASATFLNARTKEPAVMQFLGGEKPAVSKERDELQALADWLATSPLYARTQVNRIWYHLMGRGLVEPVDDFRASNPASHPELLDALTEDFVKHAYDLRRVIRLVMASRVYQLASDPTPTNADDEANHSRGIVRRLSAEQLLDSMSKVLAAPLNFPDWPEAKRLAQVPEGRKHYHPLKTDEDRFALDFGKPPRLIASDSERTNEPTVKQAFQMLSGPTLHGLLTAENNRLGQLLATTRPDAEIVDELFWTALSRPATSDERDGAALLLSKAADRRRALEDLAWALLNSKEFVFRH